MLYKLFSFKYKVIKVKFDNKKILLKLSVIFKL
jgi:hypothetical protein